MTTVHCEDEFCKWIDTDKWICTKEDIKIDEHSMCISEEE